MSNEQSKENSTGRLTFEEVMRQAKVEFLSTDACDPTAPGHPQHGRLRIGYDFMLVGYNIADNISETDTNIYELVSGMMEKTRSAGDDEFFDYPLSSPVTWLDLSRYLISRVVTLEMPIRFPELIDENERRMQLGDFLIDD